MHNLFLHWEGDQSNPFGSGLIYLAYIGGFVSYLHVYALQRMCVKIPIVSQTIGLSLNTQFLMQFLILGIPKSTI